MARPDRFPKDPEQPIYYKLHEALRTGRIRGYFSETLITLEGIQNKDRPEVLGSTRLESNMSSTGPNNITLNLTVKQDRKPLHPEVSRRVPGRAGSWHAWSKGTASRRLNTGCG